MAYSDRLYNAVMDGDSAAFDRLAGAVTGPADVTEKERWTYLHTALMTPWSAPPPDMVRRLIAWGVDVNAVDAYGATPLYYAARMTPDVPEAAQIVRLLVEAGADVEAKDRQGVTPLRRALGNPACFRALLEAGADIDQRNPGGRSIREMVELNAHASPEMKALVAAHAARPR